jgi:putative NADH-flavin reductase
MKIIIFGATGGIGANVATQALEAGHVVTAVSRNPLAIMVKHPQLETVRGDVLSSDTLAPIIAGHDAVVSALGVTTREPTVLFSTGISNILRAMQETGLKRLFCVSASAIDLAGSLLQRLIVKPLLWRIFKNGFTDMALMESLVQEQNLDWTILRPPRLTNNARTGEYNVAVNKPLPNSWFLSRADLADYIVSHLDDSTTYRTIVEIAN